MLVFPAQVAPVQLYDVAAGLQVAVSIDDPLAEIEGGLAVNMQAGGKTACPLTDTIALVVLPAPPALLPVTV